MKCQALVIRKYKKAKNDSVHPHWYKGKKSLGACRGNISAQISIGDPYGCGHGGAYLILNLTCSACKSPYNRKLEELSRAISYTNSFDLTRLL